MRYGEAEGPRRGVLSGLPRFGVSREWRTVFGDVDTFWCEAVTPVCCWRGRRVFLLLKASVWKETRE